MIVAMKSGVREVRGGRPRRRPPWAGRIWRWQMGPGRSAGQACHHRPTVDGAPTTGTAPECQLHHLQPHDRLRCEPPLLVGVSWSGAGTAQTISSATFGGTTLTSVGNESGNDPRVAIYYLLAPAASTTANVVVTFSGLVNAVAGALTFAGVNQTTPLGTFAGATGTSTAPSVNATTVANDLVFDRSRRDATLTAGAGQTSRWNVLQGSQGSASTETATTTSTTMSWTAGASGTWAIGAVPIKPSRAQPALPPWPRTTRWSARAGPLPWRRRSPTRARTTTSRRARRRLRRSAALSCGSLSVAALVSADDDITGSGDPVVYRWTCTAAGGTSLPSSVQFSVAPTERL